MKKSDKILERNLIKALTSACEIAKTRHPGFEWLTHFADYRNFPDSLQVICVFDNNASLADTDRQAISDLIQQHLQEMGLYIRHISKHVGFDSEENCLNEHDGNWRHRLP